MKKVISLISGMFLLVACQKDDTPVSVNEVSLQEAKVFVNAQADGNNQFKEKFIDDKICRSFSRIISSL